MPEVNPDILSWARETYGLQPGEAARVLGFSDTRKRTAVGRLLDYESGQDIPSRSVLTKMAKQYRRPLAVFYLSKPPPKGDRGADFRSLRVENTPRSDAVLDALIRDIRARQSMVKAVLEDEDEARPLSFIGSRKMAHGHASVLGALRELIGVPLTLYRAQPNAVSAFNLLRTRTEEAGVFVMIKGDLGSHHTAIDVEVFRGFAIADRIAPFVVINDRDARSAWSFTLLHEAVHLLFGQTGIGSAMAESDLERFCDGVAGEFLLPREEVARLDFNGTAASEDSLRDRINEFARARNVSRAMVAYQAYRAGVVGQSDYNRLYETFRREWIDERAARRERASQQDAGPDYYVVRRHRLGNGLTGLVRRMVDAEALSTTKAARILGVRLHQVQSMLSGG